MRCTAAAGVVGFLLLWAACLARAGRRQTLAGVSSRIPSLRLPTSATRVAPLTDENSPWKEPH